MGIAEVRLYLSGKIPEEIFDHYGKETVKC